MSLRRGFDLHARTTIGNWQLLGDVGPDRVCVEFEEARFERHAVAAVPADQISLEVVSGTERADVHEWHVAADADAVPRVRNGEGSGRIGSDEIIRDHRIEDVIAGRVDEDSRSVEAVDRQPAYRVAKQWSVCRGDRETRTGCGAAAIDLNNRRSDHKR